ncbi:hypothetical protein [Solirubrobacter soli]|uniref:hypothetical protein n=1 Tax=Solirubrobacter soli TaxID=363832 RepID=UPI0004236489|nr:hypothetical protein [Solirubrobacter soli]
MPLRAGSNGFGHIGRGASPEAIDALQARDPAFVARTLPASWAFLWAYFRPEARDERERLREEQRAERELAAERARLDESGLADLNARAL